MKIIVLSITPYKEKDGIIDAISENGDISFLARGIFDPKSKNAALNNTLVIADVDFSDDKYKYPLLKSSTIIENPMKVDNDFSYLSSLLFIAESTKVLLQDEEKELIFNSLVDAIIALKKAEQPWEILLAYTAKLLTIGGYEFEVNHCVFCGTTKDIVTFSFKDGGFVCRNCLAEDTERDLNKTQMLLIRSAFNASNMGQLDYKCTKNDALIVLNKFIEFITESYGVRLKSAKLINKM